MAQLIADRRDVDFVLFEQLQIEDLSTHELFAEFNKRTIDLIMSEARNLAVKEILPTQKAGDEEGCRLENGKVFVPESFHKAHKLFKEGEWISMTESPEWGGQGMPRTLALAASQYFVGANCAFMMYIGLTHGAPFLCPRGPADGQDVRDISTRYMIAWFNVHLKGMTEFADYYDGDAADADVAAGSVTIRSMLE